MIVEMKFAYEAEYVPPRGRTPRTVTVIDTVPLNVRELSPGQFPVAARFATASQMMRWNQVDEIRWDGRSHYRPYAEEWADRRFYVPADKFLELVDRHETCHPFAEVQKLPDPKYPLHPIMTQRQVAEGGRVVSDNRRERVAAMVKKGGEVVLCGDKMFEACGEPAWYVPSTGFIRAEPVLATAKTVAERNAGLARADRLDEYAERFLRNPVRTEGVLEVVMPGTLRLSVEAPRLRQAAEIAAAKMGDRLRLASREDFDVYATLRDALAAAPTAQVPEEVADAVRIAVDHQSEVLPAHERDALLKAFESWRMDLIRDHDGPDGLSLT